MFLYFHSNPLKIYFSRRIKRLIICFLYLVLPSIHLNYKSFKALILKIWYNFLKYCKKTLKVKYITIRTYFYSRQDSDPLTQRITLISIYFTSIKWSIKCFMYSPFDRIYRRIKIKE